jgi:hypothetical protein
LKRGRKTAYSHFANQTTLQHQTVTGAATPKEEICQKMGPPLHSALEQKPALNPGSFPWRP